MILHVVNEAMVAGVKEGAGALDVECVCDKAERDLSRNSTITYPYHNWIHLTSGCQKEPALTLGSVNAL